MVPAVPLVPGQRLHLVRPRCLQGLPGQKTVTRARRRERMGAREQVADGLPKAGPWLSPDPAALPGHLLVLGESGQAFHCLSPPPVSASEDESFSSLGLISQIGRKRPGCFKPGIAFSCVCDPLLGRFSLAAGVTLCPLYSYFHIAQRKFPEVSKYAAPGFSELFGPPALP